MCLGSIASLIGHRIEGVHKWSGSVTGSDDCIYGIPDGARRVVKFNPVDKSMTEIGPDLGGDDAEKWRGGVLAGNDCIYCAPAYFANRILKIDTTNSTVTLLDVRMPETSAGGKWASGALAADGCIYFMPLTAHHILKFNPYNDTVSSVGVALGKGWSKYSGTVAGNDNCLYGIPSSIEQVLRFSPADQEISFVGGDVEHYCTNCCRNGALGRDGHIYAFCSKYCQVLKIDVVNNNYSLLGNRTLHSYYELVGGWGHAILGCDGCIYWPPRNANRILKYDPETQGTSLVGPDFGAFSWKWSSGAAASDGKIYCIPYNATRILAIDPFGEFETTLQAEMKHHPSELGRLFEEEHSDKTAYECAITRFGKEKVFQVIDNCIPSHVVCTDEGTSLPSFMVAASYKNSAVSVVYFLLRKYLDSTSLVRCIVTDDNDSKKIQL